jgi:Fe-S-cluster containining protein
MNALAKVHPGERERIAALGVDFTTSGEKSWFHLPCPAVTAEGGCGMYLDRFTVCRTYRCSLLQRYQAKEISLDEAQRKVRTARELVAAVISDVPEASTEARRFKIADELGKSPADPGAKSKLMKIMMLEMFLDRWFRTEKWRRSRTG